MERPERDPDLSVVIFGDAKTKGSTRAFVPKRKDGSYVHRPNGRLMVVTKNDAGEPAEAWAGAVARECALAMSREGVPMHRDGGVWIELVFFRPRKKGDYGTGRNAGVLKQSAPAYPSVKPDVDKLARLVLDAVKGIVWGDDGQVVAMPTFKDFGDPARLELRVWHLAATVAEREALSTPQSALFTPVAV